MAGKPEEESAATDLTAEFDSVLSRMPPARPLNLAVDGATLLVANGIAVYYLTTGEMTPLELVVLVALEAIVLGVIAWIHRLMVPASARITPPETGRSKLGTALFGLVWLAAVYAGVFWMYFDAGAEVRAALAEPLAFLWQPQIRWPLLITLVSALSDAASDHMHYRERGGFLVSTPEFNGMARFLTLVFGAIPFVVPLFILGLGISFLSKELGKLVMKRPEDRRRMLLLLIPMPLLGLALLATVGGMFHLGVAGWVIGYISAKLASEALVVCLPTLLAKIRDEERAEATAAGSVKP